MRLVMAAACVWGGNSNQGSQFLPCSSRYISRPFGPLHQSAHTPRPALLCCAFFAYISAAMPDCARGVLHPPTASCPVALKMSGPSLARLATTIARSCVLIPHHSSPLRIWWTVYSALCRSLNARPRSRLSTRLRSFLPSLTMLAASDNCSSSFGCRKFLCFITHH